MYNRAWQVILFSLDSFLLHSDDRISESLFDASPGNEMSLMSLTVH